MKANVTFNAGELLRNLEELDARTDDIVERAVEKTAEDMAEIVATHVTANPEINSPATSGPYERGPGPSMSTKEAWKVRRMNKNTFQVRPRPEVEQRAIVLERGHIPNRIFPKQADVLRFTVNGVPVYRESVQGTTARRYWQGALQEIESKNHLGQHLQDEIEEEADRIFGR